MTRMLVSTGLAVALFALAVPVDAQADRATLIEEARNEFSDSLALNLLLSATDPTRAEPDSVWGVAVLDMAQLLVSLDKAELAAVWLRWAARHGSEWSIDRSRYLPAVIDAYDAVLSSVAAQAGERIPANTSWRWPISFDAEAEGVLEIRSVDPAVRLSVRIEGHDATPGPGPVALPPGTYELVASADGHEPATVTREVLPGVTTILDVGLAPLLSAEAEDLVSQWLVRVDRTVADRRVCGTGFIAGPDGLVLTALSVAGAVDGVDIVAFAGQETHADVPVASSDPSRNVAVLRLEGETGAIPQAPLPREDQYAWAVHYAGCSASASARTRLTEWNTRPGEPLTLATTLPTDAAGAPLVDRDGALLGIVIDPAHVIPISMVQDLLEQAREDQVALGDSGGGAPTWLWIALGAGAAAGAAVALGGGSSDSGTSPSPPSPTTGGITITFPLGGR
jgi:S1-C subfamily serine protease